MEEKKKKAQFYLLHKGVECMAHGKFNEAVEFYTQALNQAETKEEQVQILCHRWLSYYYLGLHLLMVEDIDSARRIDPDSEMLKSMWCLYFKLCGGSNNAFEGEDQWPQDHQLILNIARATAAICEDVNSSFKFLDRAHLLALNGLNQSAITDYITTSVLEPNLVKVWVEIGTQGYENNRSDLIEETVKKLEELGYSGDFFEAENNIIKHLYEEAFSSIKTPIFNDESSARSIGAHLHYLCGDILNARAFLMVDDEVGCLTQFDSLLLQIIFLLSEPEIPTQVDSTSPYSHFLDHLIHGIYMSLSLPLSSVPADLFIPQFVQRPWINWDTTSYENVQYSECSYPENFDKSIKNIDNVAKLFQKSLFLGNYLARNSINNREQVCLGLSLIQLVQMILKDPFSIDLNVAIATVSHWIRMYDPLAALFMRKETPFVIYLQRRGVKSDLTSYHTRVFKSLKSGLAATADLSMQKKIKSANTPEELYETILSDCCLKVGPNASLFLRFDPLRGVDMGISLPPLHQSFDSSYSKLVAMWAKLMIIIKHGKGDLNDNSTLTDEQNMAILKSIQKQLGAKMKNLFRQYREKNPSKFKTSQEGSNDNNTDNNNNNNDNNNDSQPQSPISEEPKSQSNSISHIDDISTKPTTSSQIEDVPEKHTSSQIAETAANSNANPINSENQQIPSSLEISDFDSIPKMKPPSSPLRSSTATAASENNQALSMIDATDFIYSVMEFLYEWMQITPIAQCSHTIGHVLFSALLMSYLGVEISKPMPMPIALQIEALFAVDLEMFTSLIKQRYPIHFNKSNEIETLPDVESELPTYHHRIQALIKLDWTEIINSMLDKNANLEQTVENANETQFDTSIESV